MNEFELIESYFRRKAGRRPDVCMGIGDDGAVTRVPAGQDLVTVTDTLALGTHFTEAMPVKSIGYRALAVNLSDLAAMGARPLWFTLNLSLPDVSAEWLEAFSLGLFDAAGAASIGLIGGDTVRGPLVITVTALGCVPAGSALGRGGARPAESIFITGCPGEAGHAWRQLAAGQALSVDDPIAQRFLYPQARTAEGLVLREFASAAIDLSDGLGADLEHLLASSGCGAVIDVDTLPLSAALVARVGEQRARELAIAGGDDYELCFTIGDAMLPGFLAATQGWACRVTRIGQTAAGTSVRWLQNGQPWTSVEQGYRHFDGEVAST